MGSPRCAVPGPGARVYSAHEVRPVVDAHLFALVETNLCRGALELSTGRVLDAAGALVARPRV